MKRSTTLPATLLSILLAATAGVPACAALSAVEMRMATAIDAGQDRDIGLLQRLVDQNSGTRNFDGVRAIGAMMRTELEPLGFTVRWVPMEQVGRAGLLIAEHKGSGQGKRLLLIGHMDTVFEKDSPFQTFTRRGDTVEGPGVDDMKGGLVIMLSALRAMQEAGTLKHADIRIILSGDEESAGRPIAISRRDLIEAGKWSDAALEFEGLARENGRDMGSISRRGSITWTLKTSGRTGHSAGMFSQEDGFGANYELARTLDTFRKDLREPNLTYSVGIMLGGVTATPSAATEEPIGGSVQGKANIIAGQGYATGDIRALSNDQADRIQARMRAIVADHLPGTGGEISFGEGYPAMAPTDGNAALLGKLNGVNRDLGLPEMGVLDPLKRGAGDISFVAPFTSGLAGTGAGGSGAHAAGETADLSTFPRQAKRAAILMTRLSREKREKR